MGILVAFLLSKNELLQQNNNYYCVLKHPVLYMNVKMHSGKVVFIMLYVHVSAFPMKDCSGIYIMKKNY